MIAILVAAILGAGFFWHHRGFWAEMERRRFSGQDFLWFAVLPALGAAGLWFSLVGWGDAGLRLLGMAGLPAGIRGAAGFALGHLVLGLLIFGLGSLGYLKRAWVGGLLLAGIVLGAHPGMLFLKEAVGLLGAETPLESGLRIFLFWELGLAFLISLLPSTETDSLVYHLAVPRLWVKEGRMVYLPSIFQVPMTLLSGALNSIGILFRMDTLGQALHWMQALMTAAAILSADWLGVDRTGLWFAAACFAGLPVVTHSAVTAKNDLSWSFQVFLSALILSLPGEIGIARVVLSALFCGTAAGYRFHGLFAAAVLGAAAFLTGRLSVGPLFLFWGIAVGVSLPWYIRNWVWTGNPFWPMFYSWLGGKNWSVRHEQRFTAFCRQNPLDLNRWFDFRLREIWKPGVAPQAAHYFLIPLLAAVLAQGAMDPSFFVRGGAFPFFLIAAVLYAPSAVVFEHNWWRFLLPVIPFACLLTGRVFSTLRESLPEGGWVSWVPFIFLIALVPGFWLRFREFPAPLLGLRKEEQPELSARDGYLDACLNFHPVVRWANGNLPVSSKVLFFRELRGFYLDAPYLWGDPYAQAVLEYDGLKTPEELLRALRELSITHVLTNRQWPVESATTGRRTIDEEHLKLMDDLLKRHGKQLIAENDAELYELNGGNP